jgi:hypothetical protein
MVTVVLVLIALLVVARVLTAVRDRRMRSTDGVDLSEETWEDRMHAANRAMRPYPVWTDPGTSSGSLWYDGGEPGGGDFDADSGDGAGDFGGGDSG